MLIAAGPTGVGKSWIACSRGSGFGGGDLRASALGRCGRVPSGPKTDELNRLFHDPLVRLPV